MTTNNNKSFDDSLDQDAIKTDGDKPSVTQGTDVGATEDDINVDATPARNDSKVEQMDLEKEIADLDDFLNEKNEADDADADFLMGDQEEEHMLTASSFKKSREANQGGAGKYVGYAAIVALLCGAAYAGITYGPEFMKSTDIGQFEDAMTTRTAEMENVPNAPKSILPQETVEDNTPMDAAEPLPVASDDMATLSDDVTPAGIDAVETPSVVDPFAAAAATVTEQVDIVDAPSDDVVSDADAMSTDAATNDVVTEGEADLSNATAAPVDNVLMDRIPALPMKESADTVDVKPTDLAPLSKADIVTADNVMAMSAEAVDAAVNTVEEVKEDTAEMVADTSLAPAEKQEIVTLATEEAIEDTTPTSPDMVETETIVTPDAATTQGVTDILAGTPLAEDDVPAVDPVAVGADVTPVAEVETPVVVEETKESVTPTIEPVETPAPVVAAATAAPKKIVKAEPVDPRLAQARTAMTEENYVSALTLYNGILSDNPANTAALTGQKLAMAKVNGLGVTPVSPSSATTAAASETPTVTPMATPAAAIATTMPVALVETAADLQAQIAQYNAVLAQQPGNIDALTGKQLAEAKLRLKSMEAPAPMVVPADVTTQTVTETVTTTTVETPMVSEQPAPTQAEAVVAPVQAVAEPVVTTEITKTVTTTVEAVAPASTPIPTAGKSLQDQIADYDAILAKEPGNTKAILAKQMVESQLRLQELNAAKADGAESVAPSVAPVTPDPAAPSAPIVTPTPTSSVTPVTPNKVAEVAPAPAADMTETAAPMPNQSPTSAAVVAKNFTTLPMATMTPEEFEAAETGVVETPAPTNVQAVVVDEAVAEVVAPTVSTIKREDIIFNDPAPIVPTAPAQPQVSEAMITPTASVVTELKEVEVVAVAQPAAVVPTPEVKQQIMQQVAPADNTLQGLLNRADENPRDAAIAIKVGDAYRSMGNKGKAEEWYRKALQLDVLYNSKIDRMAVYDRLAGVK